MVIFCSSKYKDAKRSNSKIKKQLQLNPFNLRADREDGGLSTLCHSCGFFLSAEGAKNVSWLWLSLLQGWGSFTMAFTGESVYIAHHFILLRLNPFDLRADRKGSWFEDSASYFRVCLSAEGAKNVSWPWLSPL